MGEIRLQIAIANRKFVSIMFRIITITEEVMLRCTYIYIESLIFCGTIIVITTVEISVKQTKINILFLFLVIYGTI